MNSLTQEQVDEAFVEIKKEWDSIVARSGQSENMAIALGCDGVRGFLLAYQEAKENVESLGLKMPVLIPHVVITIGDPND